ncbi:MAG TPA: hypothetical protein DCG19_00120 [Cryomorphaceae bacterium]|nr:hypothetical protein [Owenweeksia sp.]MBF99223.1 hypothetical protein [Owenweeksia sp.]HAD95772.1 hypothetical protein [Cryomorphaceae bacterium]HBF21546.1 hypothetical protein [Cryomorphaceae bacterium]|tara:strand:- start:552 stop:734 length:183 start_codon:yes stop_codon:yes gene_type:complete
MKNFTKYTLTLALLIILTLPAFSQPEDPDAPTPFGFVELLIGAGALYGGKKMYNQKKTRE